MESTPSCHCVPIRGIFVPLIFIHRHHMGVIGEACGNALFSLFSRDRPFRRPVPSTLVALRGVASEPLRSCDLRTPSRHSQAGVVSTSNGVALPYCLMRLGCSSSPLSVPGGWWDFVVVPPNERLAEDADPPMSLYRLGTKLVSVLEPFEHLRLPWL
ncbi:hypothetical protein VTI28DRAFT_3923 [Corynascus sepedonium]